MYRPPGARGAPSTFKLHDDDDDKKTTGGSSLATGGGGGGGPKKEEPLSKTALKNKKKREAAKKRKEEDEEVVGGGDPDAGGHQGPHVGGNNGYQGAAGLLFDAEKEKKIRKIMDKIKAIEQLKLMQAWGTHICNCSSIFETYIGN